MKTTQTKQSTSGREMSEFSTAGTLGSAHYGGFERNGPAFALS
ncbi:hypothetical protein SAMN05519103_08646 [Rhizobiales bacterium GAS113]|nr:hypothetical protein SAMN05519103_08646 [Rhizobiales bacterium GAS113]